MRVVAGIYGSLTLLSPKKNKGRPTDNKVKEAVFDILYPYQEDFSALDLFSCTGQMGIEFLSRGADLVAFNERDRENFDLLQKNLEKTGAKNYRAYRNDFRKTLKILGKEGIKFSYIYLDPPYKEDYLKEALDLIYNFALLKDTGKIITESDRELDFSEDGKFTIDKKKRYGRKIITIYKKDEGNLSG